MAGLLAVLSTSTVTFAESASTHAVVAGATNAAVGEVHAAAAEHSGEHSLPVQAARLLHRDKDGKAADQHFQISNSLVAMFIVAGILIVFAQIATRKNSLVPSGLQNFAEWVIEMLIDFLGGIMGDKLARKTF